MGVGFGPDLSAFCRAWLCRWGGGMPRGGLTDHLPPLTLPAALHTLLRIRTFVRIFGSEATRRRWAMAGAHDRQRGGASVQDGPIRWECRGCQPPILLGTYDADGQVHIKVRDRHWRILGVVQTRCPRCGAEHALDLRAGSRKPDIGSEPTRPLDGHANRWSDI
jgi:hypothetical protein